MPVTWLPEGPPDGLFDIFKKDRPKVHMGSMAICRFREKWQAQQAMQAF